MTVEKLFNRVKSTFLTAVKIMHLIILNPNAHVKTIETYILNIEQNLVHLPFCGR